MGLRDTSEWLLEAGRGGRINAGEGRGELAVDEAVDTDCDEGWVELSESARSLFANDTAGERARVEIERGGRTPVETECILGREAGGMRADMIVRPRSVINELLEARFSSDKKTD